MTVGGNLQDGDVLTSRIAAFGYPCTEVVCATSPSGIRVPRHIDEDNPLVPFGQQERPQPFSELIVQKAFSS